MGEWLLSRRGRLIVAGHEVPGPEGAKEFSPGFTPGLFSSLALALKGLSGAAKIGPEPLSRIECILALQGSTFILANPR